MSIRAAGAYEELAFVALSQVVVPEGARTEARAAALRAVSLPALEETYARFAESDAAYRALAADGVLVAQLLPRLFRADAPLVPTLREAAKRAFSELGALEATNPQVHRAMSRGAVALSELLLCDMALAAPAFAAEGYPALATHTEAAIDPLRDALATIEGLVPRIGVARVVACAALGISGRVYGTPDVPLVYAGVGEGEDAPTMAALLVLHEVAVVNARAPYAVAERAAIDAVTEVVAGSALESAHARRIGQFSLDSLAATATAATVRDRLVALLRRAP